MPEKGKVSREEVLKIAALAKLNLSQVEVERFTHQMNDILGYVEQLNELDTRDVEPLSHVLDLTNVVREDSEKTSLIREEALKNAPETDGEFFIVPEVISRSA